MVDKVLSIQPRVGGGGGGLSPEQMVLARSKEILAQVPDDLEKSRGMKDLFKTNNGLLPSLTTVLVPEVVEITYMSGQTWTATSTNLR